MEKWKDVPGFEGLYQASNTGKIKALRKERINGRGTLRVYEEKVLKPSAGSNRGYLIVTLCKYGAVKYGTVHRFVMLTWKENKDNLPSINHIDGDIKNNHIDNLEWCTNSYNSKHAFDNNRQPGSFKRGGRTMGNKQIKNLSTGVIYNSIKELWELENIGYCYGCFLSMLKKEQFKNVYKIIV